MMLFNNLRPYFFALAFLLLAISFYNAYKTVRKTKGDCPRCVSVGKNKNKARVYVWLVALIVTAMFFINYYLRFLFG